MAESIKREEYISNGCRVILDTARISPSTYETMLLRASDGTDIACMTATTAEEALEQFREIRAAHPDDKKPSAPAPLSGKYAQLCDDLKKALEAGRAAEDSDPEDGGTCNFDSASLLLPRWSAGKVKRAAKEAGAGCFTLSRYGTRLYVFSPRTRSQGNARSRNAEAMTAALRSMGYDAMVYYQMD